MQRQAFYPGKTWLDTAGKRIQAHGVLYGMKMDQIIR